MASVDDLTIRSDSPRRDTNRVAILTISILALLVSMLSFWEGHELVKPYLRPSLGRALPDKGDWRYLTVWMYVKNTGREDAFVTEVIAKPKPSVIGVSASEQHCNDDLEKAEVHPTDKIGKFGEIPHETTGLLYGSFTLPQSCSDLSLYLVVEVTFKYHDFLHIPYSQTEYIRADIVKGAGLVPPP